MQGWRVGCACWGGGGRQENGRGEGKAGGWEGRETVYSSVGIVSCGGCGDGVDIEFILITSRAAFPRRGCQVNFRAATCVR